MISLASLRDAALWDQRLCLECSATFDPSLDECPVCASEHWITAADVIAALELIEEPDDA